MSKIEALSAARLYAQYFTENYFKKKNFCNIKQALRAPFLHIIITVGDFFVVIVNPTFLQMSWLLIATTYIYRL